MRIVAIFLILVQIVALCSCKTEARKTKYNAYYFDYFDTVTIIMGYTQTKEEFDAEMRFIANKMQKMFMGSVEAKGAYDEAIVNHVKAYFAEHDYDYVQQNDENYNEILKPIHQEREKLINTILKE